jgi:hypothetical protein
MSICGGLPSELFRVDVVLGPAEKAFVPLSGNAGVSRANEEGYVTVGTDCAEAREVR